MKAAARLIFFAQCGGRSVASLVRPFLFVHVVPAVRPDEDLRLESIDIVVEAHPVPACVRGRRAEIEDRGAPETREVLRSEERLEPVREDRVALHLPSVEKRVADDHRPENGRVDGKRAVPDHRQLDALPGTIGEHGEPLPLEEEGRLVEAEHRFADGEYDQDVNEPVSFHIRTESK